MEMVPKMLVSFDVTWLVASENFIEDLLDAHVTTNA
jgi:hypothetical protein